MQNILPTIFTSSLILPLILFILSIVLYIKKKVKAYLLLCVGLFVFFAFSISLTQSTTTSSGNFIVYHGIMPGWLGDIILNIGKILIVAGFALTIFKNNYKK